MRRVACALMFGSTFVVGCAEKAGAPAPTPSGSALEAPEASVVVLPNNVTIQASANHLVAIKGNGEVAWELTLPDGDIIVAPIAVAMNSVAYVRGAKAIHAALPEGKWLWSKPLEGRSYQRARASDAPVSLSDSTVALVIGDDLLRFDHTGSVRWRVTLPDGHVSSRLAAGMDGSLIVPTTVGLFCVGPEGDFTWKRVSQR